MAYKNSTWALLSGVVLGATLLLDLTTSAISVVQPIVRLITGSPSPLVSVRKSIKEGQQECLEFGFERLPSDFTLGRIEFQIVESKGPTPISGDMLASVFRMSVNLVLPLSVFSPDTKKIEFKVNLQAKRENDAAKIILCPILKMPGTQGILVVRPEFLSVTGRPIKNLEPLVDDDISLEDGIVLKLIHPKNASVDVGAPAVIRREK